MIRKENDRLKKEMEMKQKKKKTSPEIILQELEQQQQSNGAKNDPNYHIEANGQITLIKKP